MSTSQSDNLFIANLKTISLEELIKEKLKFCLKEINDSPMQTKGASLHKTVRDSVEKTLIELSLKQYKGNQTKAAKILGINRNTLKKKIDAYNIKIKGQENNKDH